PDGLVCPQIRPGGGRGDVSRWLHAGPLQGRPTWPKRRPLVGLPARNAVPLFDHSVAEWLIARASRALPVADELTLIIFESPVPSPEITLDAMTSTAGSGDPD